MYSSKNLLLAIVFLLFWAWTASYFLFINPIAQPKHSSWIQEIISEDSSLTQEAISDFDTLALKQEYEALNGVKRDNDPAYPDAYYQEIEIDPLAKIKRLDFLEVEALLENGTGILYFWSPKCPRCRTLIVELIAVAKEKNQIIYEYNPTAIRNELVLEHGEILTKIPTSAEYAYLLEKFTDYLPGYREFEEIDPSIKRLYVPFIAFIKEGKIVATHQGTVEDQLEKYEPLTLEQKAELHSLLSQKISGTLDLPQASWDQFSCWLISDC